ncbi:MAG: D-alanyl-D-alanine carboxypeptidase/D-alanyl-D-alanine-endopeptidase [Allosphingosinicella sp.]
MKTIWLPLLALALAPLPAGAQDARGLQQRVEARLREAGPGVRFGLVVAGEDGRPLVEIAPEGRFIPASNTKIFTTAATFATFANLDRPDPEAGTAVRLEGSDVILEGRGDARLSSGSDCTVDCLATLADAVAAKVRKVRDVIGDDVYFPDQRWSAGMSWNNIPTRSGTAASALTLDDNELAATVTPGAAGNPPAVELAPYYTIDNRAVTVTGGSTNLGVDRLPGSRIVHLTGTIAAGAPPERLGLGIDDPADYAAWRLKALLEARGVRVTGRILVRHRRPEQPAPAANASPALARIVPPPLTEDLVLTNKVSQNLHAELLLRRLSRATGSGSVADGLARVRAMLERAGVTRAQVDLSDGSGMSSYNRVAPLGMVALLRWIASQPWGAAWRSTLPVAGVDGTLRNRFKGTPLEGRLFAKTGTLNASTALAGYMTARSGRTLTFSAFANDMPEDAHGSEAIDAVLQMIAQAY